MPGCTEKPRESGKWAAGSQAHARDAQRLSRPSGRGQGCCCSGPHAAGGLWLWHWHRHWHWTTGAAPLTGTQTPEAGARQGGTLHAHSLCSAPQHRAAAPAPCFSAPAVRPCCSRLAHLHTHHQPASLRLSRGSASSYLESAPSSAAPPAGGCVPSGDAQTAALQGDGSAVGPGAHAGSGCQAHARLALLSTTHTRLLDLPRKPHISTAWRGAVLREMRGVHEGQP